MGTSRDQSIGIERAIVKRALRGRDGPGALRCGRASVRRLGQPYSHPLPKYLPSSTGRCIQAGGPVTNSINESLDSAADTSMAASEADRQLADEQPAGINEQAIAVNNDGPTEHGFAHSSACTAIAQNGPLQAAVEQVRFRPGGQ